MPAHRRGAYVREGISDIRTPLAGTTESARASVGIIVLFGHFTRITGRDQRTIFASLVIAKHPAKFF
jgi:hypothetical protein